MGEALIRELFVVCLQRIEMDAQHTELEFIEVLRSFEASRSKWLHAELELKRLKELLLKSDVAQAALEVKLKHARNQVDVEIKKRYKAEADYQYLQRQMHLICDILVHDSKSSACLNEEQRSMLANFNHRGAGVTQHKSRRLSVIDESSFLSHSDISYDRTDDELDLDTTTIKPLKSRAREKRRSSMGPSAGAPAGRRGRGRSGDQLGGRPLEKDVETTIVKTSVTTPEGGGQIHMVIDITQETPEQPPRMFRQETVVSSVCEQTSVWDTNDETITEPDTIAEMEEEVTTIEPKPSPTFTTPVQKRHAFLSKTVIRPEVCVPCGKRIRFGKTALKCRDCRLVAHEECKLKCLDGCSSSGLRGPQGLKDTLESFAPATLPRIPLIIVQCVNEIEKRGLAERGIYRVPGGERMVKELREKCVLRKAPLVLGRVDDIHVVCGLLKDFLRKLKEPLVTFRLHRTFMEAAEMSDEDNSAAIMYQAIGDLPRPNRDTLSFLMLHLQRVMQSPLCQMDQNNLARVFGPTIVGHGMAEPAPMTILKDTNTQPKVITRMLSFSAEYWKRFLAVERDQVISSVVDANMNREGRGVDRGKRATPPAPRSKTKTDPSKKFFTSPTC